ncbi:transposable element Tcb1 transposase [Trichonephila clavipes]|nr:transposable element Tcb1 transposase [Trichonephila clavipes]
MLNSCVMHRHTGPAPGIKVWDSIGTLLHFSSTHCRYFKKPALHLRGVGASCPSLPSGLNWPTRSPDLLPIENLWSMVAQRLTQFTPQAAKPDQLWQRVKAAWSAVPQEHIQSLFESMPREREACDLQQWCLLWLLILAGTTLHRSL